MVNLPEHVGELPRLALILFASGLAYRQAASLLRFAFERKSDLDTSARSPHGHASWGPTNQGTAVVDPPPEAPEIAGPQAPLAEVQTGGVELIDALAEEWRELCEEEPNDQPFCRPEWVGAYLRAFEIGRASCRERVEISVVAGAVTKTSVAKNRRQWR